MIKVENICKNFGMVTAVDKISFSIAKGEVVGFVGPNGAGKTTSMRILTCFLPADSGTATVAGYDVFEQSMDVRSRVGYLPESAPLYLDMRVDAFLGYVASIRGFSGSDKKAAISRVVETAGLYDVLKKQISELSKGYRQRVGLAQALIHNPDILILDEPTSGLDPIQIKNFRALAKNLAKEKTIILSTHILPEVEAMCDRVIVIHRGRIIADGEIDALKAKSSRSNAYSVLFRGEQEKIEAGLKSLGDIVSFENVETVDGLLRYEVRARQKVRPGEQLFRMAADARLSIALLEKIAVSLETVFLEMIEDADKQLSSPKKEEAA